MFKPPYSFKNRAFTLIELLVVIAIIGLLASVVLLATNAARAKARDSQRVANLTQLKTALELYYNNNNSYPSGTYYSGWDNSTYPSSDQHCWCRSTSAEGTFEQDIVGATYLSKLPEDPIPQEGDGNFLGDGQGRGYLYYSDGQNYVLGTYLETSSTLPPSDTSSSCTVAGNYQVSEGSINPANCPAPYGVGNEPPPPPTTPTPPSNPTPPGGTPTPPGGTPTPPGGTPTPGGCGNGYSYCNPITFDQSSKYGSSATANFAALIVTSVTPSDIQHTISQTGGSYNSTIPADLIFTSDSSCNTKLSGWEFESYNPSTGAMNVWVNIGTLTPSPAVVIYMCYGNSSVTAQQGSVAETWDSNYKAVYHFPNGSSLSAKDSTSNGNNGTANSPTATTGQIDGGAGFTYTNPDSINLGTNSSLDVGGGHYTVSIWAKWNSSTVPTGQNEMSFIQSGNFSNVYGITGSYEDSSKIAVVYGACSPYCNWEYNLGTSLNDGNWHYLVEVGNGSSQPAVYVDGSPVSNGVTLGYNSSGTAIGNGVNPFGGTLDEARISNAARSADQIVAEYNNQSSPSTFYTIGAQQ